MVLWTVARAARAAAWIYRRARAAAAGHAVALEPGAIDAPSPARRRFLEQTAVALSATPFVAAAYGLLYGRLDVEVTHRRIRLARLPKAFEGFRIAQLSDVHISPFMPADEIRRCVTITNQLKADLVVMTGDYLAWDPAAQGEVVQALAGLRAPYGVFDCLGNHEVITQTEESIARLFAAQGIRILRQERAPIQLGSDTLNLIGIDDSQPDFKGVERLVMPDTVNILLCHFPDFDRAVRTRHRLDAGRPHARWPVVARGPPPRQSLSPDWRRATSADGTKKPAYSSTSTAASEPPPSPSGSAPGRKLQYLNWCAGSKMREVEDFPTSLVRRIPQTTEQRFC